MQQVQPHNLEIAPRVHVSVVKNFAQLGRLPQISVVEHPESYPMRFPVPDRFLSWGVSFPQYSPFYAESERIVEPSVLATSFEGPFESDGETRLPLNPVGRTGLLGRGALWAYGPNHAADAAVVRGPKANGEYEILLIEREDGSWALPGGFVDQGEEPCDAMIRELGEEALLFSEDKAASLKARATLLYQGYADDPRNTDNAWIETSAYLLHVTEEESEAMELCARDDAQRVRWAPLSHDTRESLYASHPQIATLALRTVKRTETLLAPYRNPQIHSLSELIKVGHIRIGIFGGTFDPIHKGHLEAAEAALCSHDLDAIVFMPAKQNPLKGHPPHYTEEARMRQIVQSIVRIPSMYVSPLELERAEGEPSYLIDSLRELQGQAPEADLFFVHGADTLEELSRWKDLDDCMGIATFLPVKRNEVQRDEVINLTSRLSRDEREHLYRAFVDVEIENISSTEIRRRRQ